MKFATDDTAVVIIDLQNDVLSPHGKNWDSFGASVTENDAATRDVVAAMTAPAGEIA